MWNLAFDSLLQKFDKGTVEIFGYADDACLITTAHDPKIARKRMQEAVNKCTAWGDQQGLRFSPKKTVIILFTRRKTNIDPEGKIRMYDQEVEYSESARYLGVYMDSELRWREHFKRRIDSAKALLFKARNALGITWGLKPHLLRWVYTGIVRPAIVYGSIVWAHSITQKDQIQKLRKLHGTILRMMCPKRKSTPVAGMEMICYVPPLELVIKGEAVKAHMRNIHMLPHDWPSINKKGTAGHVQANWWLCEKFDVPDMEWDRETAKLHFDNNYYVEEDSFEKGLDISWPGALMVYTDGSLVKEEIDGEKQNRVGCGFYIMKSDFDCVKEELDYGCFHLQEHNSVYQAETTAMHRAVIHLLKTRHGERRRRIYLLSDSKGLVQSLQRHWQEKKTVNSLIESLNILGSYDDIHIRWVKAHANCVGNNRADTLARYGAQPDLARTYDVEYEEITDISAPYSFLTQKVQKGTERLWTEKWMGEVRPNGSPHYRQTKHWFPEPCKGLSYDLVREDRETLGKCMQFITGHARMKRHQHLIDSANASNADASHADDDTVVTSPSCRLCNRGEETPFHLVLECNELKVDSYRCFGNQDPNHNRRNYKFRWKTHKLIAFLSNPTLNPLLGLGEPDEQEEADDEDVMEENDDDMQQTSAEADDGNGDELQANDTIMRNLFNGNCRGI